MEETETKDAKLIAKVQKLFSTNYPISQAKFTDLVGDQQKTIVSIFAKPLAPISPKGIMKNDDGTYEIVVEEKCLSKRIVLREADSLSAVTGIKYEIQF